MTYETAVRRSDLTQFDRDVQQASASVQAARKQAIEEAAKQIAFEQTARKRRTSRKIKRAVSPQK